MEDEMKDVKKIARQQYLKYFSVWFIGILVLAGVAIASAIFLKKPKDGAERKNDKAPEERVYDYAGILDDEEEDKLRDYIAEKEEKYQADFVIVTLYEPVVGEEAYEYGHHSKGWLKEDDLNDWEAAMMDIADYFWDENKYGYNKGFEGDGSILVDNRYPEKDARGESQRGEWLSTSGKVEDALGYYDVERVLYAVDDYYETDPYKAYKSYIDKVCYYLDKGEGKMQFGTGYYIGGFFVITLICIFYCTGHLKENKSKDTTTASTYVVGGKPQMRNANDALLRKSVTKRRIETSSGSHGGGGGHHTSHSGASHGGGGHRH